MRQVLHDVLIENNTVINFGKSIGITTYGAGGVDVHRVAVIGNACKNTGGPSNDTAISFEEEVRNCLAYGNTVNMWGRGSVNGIVCSKDTQRCIIGNNTVRNSRDGLGVMNFEYNLPDGPPRHNLVTHNDVRGCRSGFAYRNLKGDLTVYYNHMENNTHSVNNQGNNSGDNYYISDNGPNVPTADTGIPDAIESEISYSDPDDVEIGRASWDPGTISPDKPVLVEVKTSV